MVIRLETNLNLEKSRDWSSSRRARTRAAPEACASPERSARACRGGHPFRPARPSRGAESFLETWPGDRSPLLATTIRALTGTPSNRALREVVWILRPTSSPDASDPPPTPGGFARRRPGTPRRPPVARGPPPRRRRRSHWAGAGDAKTRKEEKGESNGTHFFLPRSRRGKRATFAAIPPFVAARPAIPSRTVHARPASR